LAQSDGKDAMNDACCIACGGIGFDQRTANYRSCLNCGHETLMNEGGGRQQFILNDPLEQESIRQLSRLDRFKRSVLERLTPPDSMTSRWVDVGSASGRYLYQNKHRFSSAIGVEITPSAVSFSREMLGLEIVTTPGDLPGIIDIATAWHSLEHFPREALEHTLAEISLRMPPGAKFIVSVPNARSFQYRWLHGAYAFYDVPNHLHQFTNQSLDFLMSRYGFERQKTIFSRPYNTFGWTQGFLNVLTLSHNYLYYRLKRKNVNASLAMDFANFVLLPLTVPLGWIFGIMEAWYSDSQGVITACYRKKIT
jgi:hypothetical protein